MPFLIASMGDDSGLNKSVLKSYPLRFFSVRLLALFALPVKPTRVGAISTWEVSDEHFLPPGNAG